MVHFENLKMNVHFEICLDLNQFENIKQIQNYLFWLEILTRIWLEDTYSDHTDRIKDFLLEREHEQSY